MVCRVQRFVRAASVSALVAVVVLLAGRWSARRFLFPAQDLRAEALPRGLVELRATASDGVEVRALELAGASDRRTVVHFHTNRETAESVAGYAHALHAHGLGVVLVEYRGYGHSQGMPTERGLYADAEAVLDALSARGWGADRIVLSGASLGSGVAAEMARRGRGARLVLVAPYTSIPAVVEDAAPIVPARIFIDDRFETLAKASAITVPTLIIHGDADEIVPFWMGEMLGRRIAGATLHRVASGRHGDLFARDPSLVARIAGHAS